MPGIRVEDFDELWTTDRLGERLRITPLAGKARRAFRRAHSLAANRLNESPSPIDELYDLDPLFKEATDYCLAQFNLSPEDLDLSRIVAFLYVREEMGDDEKPVLKPGLLVSMEFPSAQVGEPLDPDLDPDDYAAATLWTMNGGDVSKALTDMEAVSGRRLQSLIRHRNYIAEQADPVRQKERQEAAKAEAELELVRQIQVEVLQPQPGSSEPESGPSEEGQGDDGWVPVASPI